MMQYPKITISFLIFFFISLILKGQISLTEYFTGSPFTNLTAVNMVQGKAYIGSTCLAENKNSCLNMMKTTNQGNSWNYVSSCSIDPGDPFDHITKMHFVNAEHGFILIDELRVGTHETKILVTHDGGLTWMPVYHYPVEGDHDQLNDMIFFNANTGLAIGQKDNLSKGTLVRTTNGGNKWTENFNSFPHMQLLSLNVVNDSVAYMAGQDGSWINKDIHWYLYKTFDRGLSWVQIFSDTVAYTNDYDSKVSEIHFINEMEGWMAYSGFSRKYSHLYHTVDGGLSWTELEVPIPEPMDLNDILFINANEGFIAAGDWCDTTGCHAGNALLYTTDGGQNWEFLKHDPYDPYMFYAIDYDGNTGYVAGGGYGIDKGRIFKIHNEAVAVDQDVYKGRIRIYPNPARDFIYIEANGFKCENHRIQLFNLNGQEILRQVLMKKNTKINIGDLNRGVYVISIRKDKKLRFEKLVVN